ncbi:hypothetical protein SADUNF_Sadunf02G0019100 [Salix dunnii]|uniref:Uncharacterized protein n=1 Tax=Salix dunnii TaxID=1413687 RepID=A0A835N5M8_9ROSI|nr:hypothetical protein SADUNF_Sadunf02G0019100 [Salix dunnii]
MLTCLQKRGTGKIQCAAILAQLHRQWKYDRLKSFVNIDRWNLRQIPLYSLVVISINGCFEDFDRFTHPISSRAPEGKVSSIEAPANIPGKNTDCGGASGKCSEGCKCVHKFSTSGIKAPCPCCGANMTTPGGRRMSP